MNIAIIGKSKINGVLRKCLAEEGFIPFLFDNIDDIKEFGGEKGKYVVKTNKSCIDAGYIIITEEPETGLNTEQFLSEDIPVHHLSKFNDFSGLSGNKTPIIIILDLPYESSTCMTGQALEKAIILARKQQKVIYLARFMRTGEKEFENLYKEARNLGVTFAKYNEVSIEYNSEEDTFSVKVTDDFDSFNVDTRILVAADRFIPGENFKRIEKLLRLRFEGNGFTDNDACFMFPTLTNRKGIYYLNLSEKEMLEDEIKSRIMYTILEIKSELPGYTERSTRCYETLKIPFGSPETLPEKLNKYADIDAGKCAFCYTCYRACPHSAMVPDNENSVMKNLKGNCYACGICVAVCPADAIRISDVDDENNKNNKNNLNNLEILCCENSGEIAVNKLTKDLRDKFEKIKVSPVSCGGEISVERIIESLKYNRKVLVVICMEDACRHFEGNKRSRRQVEKAREVLKASGLDESRVGCINISHAMSNVLGDYIKEIL